MPARSGRLSGSVLVGRRISGRIDHSQREGGAMGKIRPNWLGAAAVVTIGAFLAACSPDPIQPAPVLMMGGNRATDARTPAITASRPVSAPETRVATAAPMPAAKHLAPGQRASSRAAIVAKHPTHTQKAARTRLTTRQATAAKRRVQGYTRPGIAPAAARERQVP